MAISNTMMYLFPDPPRTHETPSNAIDQNNSISGLTVAAKQAMIDDLQLEITARARRLRSVYSDQARSLRATLERRINRIPPRLRKLTMGEVAEKHAQTVATQQAQQARSAQLQSRAAKRSSVDAFGPPAEDKENANTDKQLTQQKKRVKTTHTANGRDRQPSPAKLNVLSPRSHNSRTLPRSPLKSMSPEKRLPVSLARTGTIKQPISRAPSRAISRQGKPSVRKPISKPDIGSEIDSRDSEGSAVSAKTTIVRKINNDTKKQSVNQKTAPKTTTAARKRNPPAKKDVAVPAPTRTLRKRG